MNCSIWLLNYAQKELADVTITMKYFYYSDLLQPAETKKLRSISSQHMLLFPTSLLLLKLLFSHLNSSFSILHVQFLCFL